MSYITIQTRTSTAVPDGGTIEFNYPAGASSTQFIGARGHRILLNNNDLLTSDAGHFEVSFDDAGIVVTNASEFTWAADTPIAAQFIKTAQTAADGAIEGNDVDFDLDPLGVNASSEGLLALWTTASRQQRPCDVLPGSYKLDRQLLADGLSDLVIRGGRGVEINDPGRLLTRAQGGTMRLPWGTEFLDCGDVTIEGIRWRCNGTSLGGSSTGSFNYLNYELRKPVIGFIGCERIRLRRIGHQGNPGQNIQGSDRDDIVTALGLTPTPNEYAYFALRGAFFNTYQCFDVVREDSYLAPDTCLREQVTFCDTEVLGWHRERSVSTISNFASLGKIIGCRKVRHGGHYVSDPSTTSLVDMIGEDIHFYGADLDFPNGKAFDVSQEWNLANQPSRNIRVSNVNTTGVGAVCAGGSTEEMEAGPITDYVVENCRYNIGETVFSADLMPSFQGVTDITSINDVFLNGSPFGRSWNVNGGTGTVKLVNPRFTWTKSAASLNLTRRQSITRGCIVYENVDWLQNASLAGASNGLASFVFAKDADAAAGAKHVFIGGRIRDALWNIAADVVVEVHGAALETFATTGSGTFRAIGCTLDGLPYNTLPPEYADDAAAAVGLVPIGGAYRTGSALKTRVT